MNGGGPVTRRRVAQFAVGERQLAVVALGARDSLTDAGPGRDELARFHVSDVVYAIMAERQDLAAARQSAPADVLTGREMQIVALVARGLLNKQVADQLHISEWTVCAHLRRIYAKLQVSTRAAMVYRCVAAMSDGGMVLAG